MKNTEFELKTFNYGDLTTPTIEFDFEAPPIDPILLSEEMMKILEESNGIGLSANQLGLPWSVFVIKGLGAFFNPKIVWTSDDVITLEEGCSSFPNLILKIERPTSIRIRAANQYGNIDTKLFTGMTSRAIMHEMDHLEGKLFYNRASFIHRERQFAKMRKRNK